MSYKKIDALVTPEEATRVFQILGSMFFFGEFKAETPNELELEKILEKTGYLFKNEDELFHKLFYQYDDCFVNTTRKIG